MTHGLNALLLIAGSAAVAGVASRLRLSAPLLLVAAGLALSYLPHLPTFRLDPALTLFFVLPPLVFAAAWQSSVVSLRANLRPIGLLSVGLVLFTVVVVGIVAHALVPGLTLRAAFTLGAIVAPTDAVAATSIGSALGLPRRLVVILAGESLVNDATALTAYRVAAKAATAGSFSLLAGLGEFVLAAAGGVAIGWVLAVATQWLLERLRDPLLENTVLLLAPFVGYGLADQIHASGVLAVAVAGLYLGHHAPQRSSYATRLQGNAIWAMIEFLLESVVFALIGLQLRSIVDQLSGGYRAASLLGAAAVVVGTVIVTRFAWIYPATYLPRLIPAVRARDPVPAWTQPTVLAWAGMRGVVSLAAAIALPAGFPQRDLLQFLTFCVTIGTLVVQGLSLPALIRRLGVVGTESSKDTLAEAAAQHAAANAGLERLDVLLAGDGDGVPADVIARLREKAEIRQLSAWERLGGSQAGRGYAETPSASYRRLRREMLDAERSVWVRLRNDGRIDDDVLQRVQRELDLEEALLARE